MPLYFERKSLGDLYGTLGKGNRRFRKEVDRAAADNVELRLVIECGYKKVHKGAKYSTLEGSQILRTLATFDVKHNLRYWCFKDRDEVRRYIEETYFAISRCYRREK